jgi:hypothetical protein
MSYPAQPDDFHALSIKDLLEARDAYHVFMMRKTNVVGTAIGSYRKRKAGVSKEMPKTLANTEIRRGYSWPCVLVFVNEWIKKLQFGKAGKAGKALDDFLPRRLYLPDGREIPVCVILTEWNRSSSDTLPGMKFPGNVIGGGYPVMTVVQGKERWATLGCLVSDGRITYGLTNAHVVGQPGEKLMTILNGNEYEIGVSAQRQANKVFFTDLYPNFPGKHTMVNMDIGLIEFNDINHVTSQVYGLDRVNGLIDINHDTLSLDLIGCPVMGFGCASGLMKGEIIGMFYRYATSGGYDIVSDYLIGPRFDKKQNKLIPFVPTNGDSGTLLVTDLPGTAGNMKAIGILWGGQRDISGKNQVPYGLATNLGTICKYLDVELISNWNTGYDRYFGAYAHVVLPSLCPALLKNKKFRKLMENNTQYISKNLEETDIGDTEGLSKAEFVPLADVPDLVWKMMGGKYKRGKEGPNHFADMDQPNAKKNGKTLLELCNDHKNIDPDFWMSFYDDIGVKEKGALPFRIAQVFDDMVRFAASGDRTKFVGAAGILTHYVFDASLMMHISYLHHGNPDGEMVTKGDDKVPLAYDVHDEFDNQLVERFSKEIRRDLPGLVKKKSAADEPVKTENLKTTKDAAIAAFILMKNAFQLASPADIVSDFESLVNEPKQDRAEELWKKYGGGLLQAIAEGVVLAARLWEAAWIKGKGSEKIKDTSAVSQASLKKLYQTKEGFLNSVNLKEIKTAMRWES